MPSHKLASLSPVAFTAHNTSDDPIDASALTFTVRIVKPDGTSVAGGATGGISNKGITQPDVTNALGVCYYTPVAGDLSVLGDTVIRISAAGMKTREILVEVVAYDRADAVRLGLTGLRPDAVLIGQAVTGTLTSNAFSTNLTLPAGQLANEAHCRFLGNVTAALAGQVQKITGYAGGVLSFTVPFSTAPANLDQFVIING